MASGNCIQSNSLGLAHTSTSEALVKMPEQCGVSIPDEPIPLDFQGPVKDKAHVSRTATYLAGTLLDTSDFEPGSGAKAFARYASLSPEPDPPDSRTARGTLSLPDAPVFPDPQIHVKYRVQTSITTAEVVDCMTKPNLTESGAITKTPDQPSSRNTELLPPDPQFHVHNRVWTSSITAEVADCMTKPDLWVSNEVDKMQGRPSSPSTEPVSPDPQFHESNIAQTSGITAEVVDCMTKPHIWESSAM